MASGEARHTASSRNAGLPSTSMKTLARTLITVVAVSIAVRLVGREMAKRFQGDTHPDNDTFRVMAFLGGSSISSHALSLRSIQAKVRAAVSTST